MAVIWTNKGQEKAIDLIDPNTRSGVPTVFYVNWGSSATAPAVGDTTLGTELAEARSQATNGNITQPSTDKVQWVATVTAGANRTVNEAGLFDASTSGNLWIRGTHSTLNIETGDRVEYTFTLTLKDVSE